MRTTVSVDFPQADLAAAEAVKVAIDEMPSRRTIVRNYLANSGILVGMMVVGVPTFGALNALVAGITSPAYTENLVGPIGQQAVYQAGRVSGVLLGSVAGFCFFMGVLGTAGLLLSTSLAYAEDTKESLVASKEDLFEWTKHALTRS